MLHHSTFSPKIVSAFGLLLVLLLLSTNQSPLRASSAPYLVKDINPNGSSAPTSLTAWQAELYFQIGYAPKKNGLWQSDGTAQATTRLKKLESISFYFFKTKTYLYFTADDGAHGIEPWRTDGTRDGTRLINGLPPGQFIGSTKKFAFLSHLTDTNTYELYRANGKPNGTRKLADVNARNGVAVGNLFLFPASDPSPPFANSALWKSDGTSTGTSNLKDIAPLSELTAHDGAAWFFARDDLGTYSLWRSDGSEDGTQLIKPLGTNVAVVRQEQAGEKLFFVLRDNDAQEYALWVSDGTMDGTEMINDIGSSDDVDPPMLRGIGNTLYFGLYLGALWKSDGTAQTTTKIVDATIIRRMTSIGNTLFFVNSNYPHGFELWQSDGTAEGTFMVADINPNDSAFPDWLTRVKDTLFFTADDGTHGIELWAYKP